MDKMIRTLQEMQAGAHSRTSNSKDLVCDTPRKGSWVRQYYYQILSALEILIDYLTLFACFLLAKAIYDAAGLAQFSELGLLPQPISTSILIHVAIACAITIIVFFMMGLYERKATSLLNIDEIRKLLKSVFLLAAIVLTVSFYFRIPYSRMLITIWISLITVFMIVEKMIFYKIHQRFHVEGFNIRRVLIYGSGEIGRKLYKKISAFPKLGYRAVGFLDEDLESFSKDLKRVEPNLRTMPQLLGKSEDLESVIQRYRVDELFIARKGLSAEEIISLTHRCREMGIRFKIIPQLLEGFIENLSLQEIGGIPLIGEKEAKVRHLELFIKRVLDLLVASTAFVFFLPLFLAIAILIKLDSPGAAMFRQTRVGKDGKDFTIYKFRTMYTETGPYLPCPRDKDDPRISRVGRFLRKTSLDELPQIYNVIRGEMSLVGPRPEMPFIVAQYNPLHRKRLTMKPGMTGLWQISSDRTEEIHENIDYDLYYVENFSILLDVAIIARTFLYALVAMRTH